MTKVETLTILIKITETLYIILHADLKIALVIWKMTKKTNLNDRNIILIEISGQKKKNPDIIGLHN